MRFVLLQWIDSLIDGLNTHESCDKLNESPEVEIKLSRVRVIKPKTQSMSSTEHDTTEAGERVTGNVSSQKTIILGPV